MGPNPFSEASLLMQWILGTQGIYHSHTSEEDLGERVPLALTMGPRDRYITVSWSHRH